MVVCRPYEDKDAAAWNNFVKHCRTPLFMFNRGFMGYHADRFVDASIIFEAEGQIIGLLPASQHGKEVISHGGLTYGGILTLPSARANDLSDIITALLAYLKDLAVEKITYKAIPYFLSNTSYQEDLYFLHCAGAQLVRRDLSSVIDLSNRLKYSKGRKWLISRANKQGLRVTESQCWEEFHSLLSKVLAKHQATPVHSAAELRLLAERFSENLKLYVIFENDDLLAAALIFRFVGADHTQYLAVSDRGKESGALDLLISHCIDASIQHGQNYFSFGISTEQRGRVLNQGLVSQKEGFGARGTVLDFYEIGIR